MLDRLSVEIPNRYHPVAWFGRIAEEVIEWIEGKSSTSMWQQRGAGVAIAVGFPAAAVGAVVVARGLVPDPMRLVMDIWLLGACFTLTGLGRAALRMADTLERDGVEAGRVELMHLCSRSSQDLSASELSAATIESVAENTSDSFVAPLFCYLVFGLEGAIIYRIVNTLDAMIGYFGRYTYLGWASARLDDVLNYIPARITAALLLVSGGWHGASVSEGLRILQRDGRRTPSPNAGQPMAAMAGLLGVRLEKLGVYGLGDPHSELSPETIRRAWKIADTSGWLAFGIGVCCLA